MSHSEMFAEQQQQDEWANQAEEELYASILEALTAASKLGLSEEHMKVLRYATGVTNGE